MSLITKSVILQPGEPFTLPPGAVIIGSDDPTSLTNTCEEDIPLLVYTTVYLAWDIPDVSSSSGSDLEATDRNEWIGLRIGATYYSFATPRAWTTTLGITQELEILSNTVYTIKDPAQTTFNGDPIDGGRRYLMSMQVLDNIKNDVYAVRKNTVNGDIGAGTGLSSSTMYVRFKEDLNSLL